MHFAGCVWNRIERGFQGLVGVEQLVLWGRRADERESLASHRGESSQSEVLTGPEAG